MNTHLTTEELAAVIAGLEIDHDRRQHFDGCVVCRAEAAGMDELIEARRGEILADEPDWEDSAAIVMDRLAESGAPVAARRPRWLRPVLAMAAMLVLAVGVGVMLPGGAVDPVGDDLAVEEILAEMDALLADDSIPGFEVIDPWVGELETDIENGAS